MQNVNRRKFLQIAGTGSAMLAMNNFNCQNHSKTQTNFLIYLADDQYKDSVGCYGADPGHSHNIDKLAEQGMRFTRCFVQSSICTPNRGTLLTGMYPLKHGAHANHSGFYDGVKSLPNYMQEIGYRACIVGKDGIQKPSDLYEWEFRIKKSDEHVPGADEPKHDRHRKTRFDEVEAFLNSDSSRPFCIFHAASLPHSPALNEIPNGLKGYNAANWYMDYELGRYMELLEKYNLENNTVVIYANDNEAQLSRTKNTLYDTGLNVPFIVSWPGHIKAGSVSDAMVGFIDIMPTFMDIAGHQAPAVMDGKSMKDVWQGNTDRHHDEIYASYTGVNVGGGRLETPYPIRSIRTDKYKFIRYLNHMVPHPKFGKLFPAEELFDLERDPKEQHNLAANPDYQQIKKELSAKVDAWMQRIGDKGIESELATLEKYPPKDKKK